MSTISASASGVIMSDLNLLPLKASALFAGMTEGEILSLNLLFQEKPVPAGKTVFIENMPGESLYLIREGTIRISKMLAEGDEQTLVVLAAEDTFGEMAVLDSAPRSATARVIEDARLLAIGREPFERFCDNHPALGLKLLRNISRIFARRVREEHEEFRALFHLVAGRKET